MVKLSLMRVMARCVVLALLVTNVFLGMPAARAEPYPDRPVRLVIPFPPGGSTDFVGRFLAQRLTEILGQPVVVENVPGAGGGVGVQRVATSKPDGYSLVFTAAGAITLVPLISRDTRYNVSSLTPIAIAFRSPLLLVVKKDSPYRTLSDLLKAGKEGSSNAPAFGSSGYGALSHVAAEILNIKSGSAFVHIPFKGGPATMQAMLAGDVQWALISASDGKSFLDDGRLRPLVVLSADRSPLFPDVPTVSELGINSLDLDVWFGLFAPNGLPDAVFRRIDDAVRTVMRNPAFIQKMKELNGTVPDGDYNSQSILINLREEAADFEKVVRALDIRGN